MEEDNKFIRFDWTARRILRDKASFGVIEGFINVLIGEYVSVIDCYEDISEREDELDTSCRFSLMLKNSQGEILRVNIQFVREWLFLRRAYHNIVWKTHLCDKYDQVKKVYSISILYFDLGVGADYLYHGQNNLIGVHTKDTLRISTREREQIIMTTPEKLFPEYYIIRVNEFNKVATTPLEEWLDYLKNGHIKPDTKAPGLEEARQRLDYMKMSREERRAYERHMDNIMVQNDVLETKVLEGLEQGRAEGRAEGERVAKMEDARKMIELNIPLETISMVTGLSAEEITSLNRM